MARCVFSLAPRSVLEFVGCAHREEISRSICKSLIRDNARVLVFPCER